MGIWGRGGNSPSHTGTRETPARRSQRELAHPIAVLSPGRTDGRKDSTLEPSRAEEEGETPRTPPRLGGRSGFFCSLLFCFRAGRRGREGDPSEKSGESCQQPYLPRPSAGRGGGSFVSNRRWGQKRGSPGPKETSPPSPPPPPAAATSGRQ